MPKIVDTVSVKKEILNKCFELFAERGFSNLSMRNISKELNLTTGKLYHYFPSKDNLFYSLVNHVCTETVLGLIQGISPKDPYEDKFNALVDQLRNNQLIFRKIFYILSDFYRFRKAYPSKLEEDALTANLPNELAKLSRSFGQPIMQLLNINEIQAQFIVTLFNGWVFRCIVDSQYPDISQDFEYLKEIMDSIRQ